MKSRALLINPRACSPRSLRLPLSVLALGAGLEGRYEYDIVDGNRDASAIETSRSLLSTGRFGIVGCTVMPGPQLAPAIEISAAIRAAYPAIPIVWGGYFPSLYPEAAINAPYVDMVVRGQGEEALPEILDRLQEHTRFAAAGLGEVAGLTWKDGEQVIHNPERRIHGTDSLPPLNYARLQDVAGYLRPSFMGARTAVHQAAVGCRYHCDFCGVVSMFNGKTVLQAPRQLELALTALRDRYGATAVQFYDNNFFDREPTSIPTLELLAKAGLPWWCYARADTLAKFSAATWQLICKSRLKMAYIGVESASDEALTRMRKGTKVEHTVEVAHRCREAGIVPEFSFILGGPEDPEGEIEATFRFIRKLKAINPGCEVILYFYSPTPQRHPAMRSQGRTPIPRLAQYGPAGPELPETPEEWTQPQWISYVCHQDAPWLTEAIRRRVRDFAQVLSCRFPTAQDYRTPWWGKLVLRELARPRYAQRRYGKPWELSFARRIIPLRDPATESL